jgi:hypothetical protein
MSMNMQSKSTTRQASTVALFLTFAGVLFAQTPGNQSDSVAPLELIALSTPHSSINTSVSDTHAPASLTNSPSSSTPSSITPSLASPTRTMPGTLAGASAPASATTGATSLNTIASAQEQSTKRSGFIGVQPGIMPLDIRMDPTSTQKYGAAPAMAQIRIGRN